MGFLGIGAALFGAGTFLAAGADLVIGLSASIGLSYAAQALAGKPQPSAITAPDVAHFSAQGTMQAGGVVPREFILGKTCTAGLLCYHNTWGMNGETPNAYYTQVIRLSDLPIKGLLAVWVNGVKCTLDGAADANFGYPVLEYRKDGVDHVWVKFYDGTQVAVDPFLVNFVNSPERPYQNTRIFTGVAYAIATALVDDTLFAGFPQYKFEVDGIRLYDPTKDSSNGGDGVQRFSDIATWGGDGDDYPGTQIYNVLRGIRYNGQWVYGLQRTVEANLPTINWNVQIGKCRAPSVIDGGSEPTYRSGGIVQFSSRPCDLIDALSTSCQGKLSEVGGFYKMHLGEPDSPSFSFTDDDIMSTEEQTYKPFLALANSINGIAASYIEPAQGWASMPVPPLYRPDLEAIDGGRRLMANPSFDMVYSPTQAQRLVKSALEAARKERAHALTLPPRYWTVEPGDVGTWTSARNRYDDKRFEVTAISDKANLDVGINIQEVDPADYIAPDYQAPVFGPVTVVRPAPQPIVAFDAQPTSLEDEDGFARRPGIELSWNGAMPGVIGVRWTVRLKKDQSFVTSGNTDLVTEGRIVITASLLPLVQYEVQAQYIPSAPRDMLWSDWITVTTPDTRMGEADIMRSLLNLITQHIPSQIQQIRFESQEIAMNAAAQDAANEITNRFVRTLLSAQGVEIKETAQIAIGIDGKLTGAVFNTIDNNGFVTGTYHYNDGTTAPFTIVCTDLYVAAPGVNGGEPVNVFRLETGDAPAIYFAGDFISPGSIKVYHIDVATLTAISAHFGDAQVDGKLTGGSGGLLDVDFTSGSITGYRIV